MTFRHLDTPFGRNKLDLNGQTIGGAVILRAAYNAQNVQRWWFRCACGAEAMRDTGYLRKAQLGGTPVRCESCTKVARARGGAARGMKFPGCSICHSREHNCRRCPQRPKSDRQCSECEGMSWRRPVGSRRLCRCGEPYAAEPPVTLADVMAAGREDRRVVP